MVSNGERDGWSRKKRETGQLESREAEVCGERVYSPMRAAKKQSTRR